MNGILLFAFIVAFGNTAFAMGAKDYTSAIVSGVITGACVIVGIYGARE